jgi:hypothetical protein
MYKNANIKSYTDLVNRLENGEVFWIGADKVWFNANEQNPFRLNSLPLNKYFSQYKDFTTATEWYENIPQRGVLCWVDDFDPKDKVVIDIIYRVDNENIDKFKGRETSWRYATPLTNEELDQFKV